MFLILDSTYLAMTIDKLLEKVGNTTNIQNNIHVNNYGNEDLTHISKSMMDDLTLY